MTVRTTLARCLVGSLLVATGWFASLPNARGETAGRWQERSQVVWNEAERKFARKTFRVWDPRPELDLEFRWEGHDASSNESGTLSGSGRLIWKARGTAPYEKVSVYSEYNGELVNGRPHGFGRITLQSGLDYQGDWKDGLMEGLGSMRLPNGDEYVGDFLAGQPHGNGRYATADGAVFEGSFRDGQTTQPVSLALGDKLAPGSPATSGNAPSRLINAMQFVADTPDKPIQLVQAPGGIVLRVFTDRQRNQDFIKQDADTQSFVYDQANAPGGIRIRLASKEIMDLWKGSGAIKKEIGAQSFALFAGVEQFAPVFLVIEIGNDAARATQIVGGYIDIEESVTDLQPYLTIKEGCDADCGAGFQPVFEFVNAGWGGVRDARLTYSFGNETSVQPRTFVLNGGSFDQAKKLSVVEGIQASGVNLNQLRTRAFRCGSWEQVPACSKQVVESGLLGRLSDAVFTQANHIYTRVAGKIEYTWIDRRGNAHQRETPISVYIRLIEFQVPDMAEMAAPGPVDRKLSPVKLDLDRTSYRIPVNYRARVGPRETNRFALSLLAEKSSQHVFTIVLETADGNTVRSPKFDLLYFAPRFATN